MKRMGRRTAILLAESDAVVGMDVSDTLERAGYRVLGPAGTAAEALRLLEQESPALAVIDVDLRDGRGPELARALRRRDVAFLVHSDRRQDQRTTDALQGVPWLGKPAVSADLVACVNELSTRAVEAPGPAPAASAGNPLVRKLEGFTSLTEADRAILERISAEPRLVAPGTDLVREGDGPDGVFLVMEGMACRHKLRAGGTRQIMAYLVPGDLCDLDVALLDEMDHTISTLSACRVVRLPPETVADLLEHHPRIARALRTAQLVDAATLREWLVNVGRRSARERIAHLFCELVLRLRVVGRAPGNAYALPVTQADLADTCGLTSVHVNRMLGELRHEGLIELRSKHLRILDLTRLRAMAEFRPNYLHLGDQAAA